MKNKEKEKILTTPYITKEQIDKKITNKIWKTHECKNGNTIYVCCIEMENGFAVVGEPLLVKDKEKQNVYPIKEEYFEITKSNEGVLRFCAKDYGDYVVIGSPSASVSPENDDEELGKQIAYNNMMLNEKVGVVLLPNRKDVEYMNLTFELAYNKIWGFEGYLLAESIKEK